MLIVSGSVYCFGDNTNNQLGKKNTVDGPAKCNRPERIKFPSGVKMKTVSCGADYTAAVSGGLTFSPSTEPQRRRLGIQGI